MPKIYSDSFLPNVLVCSTCTKVADGGLFVCGACGPCFILLRKSAPYGRLAAIRPLSLGVSLAPIRSNPTRPDFIGDT